VSRNCWWEQLRCTPQTFGTTYLQQQPNPALRCVGPMVPDACAMILWAKQVFYALLLRRGDAACAAVPLVHPGPDRRRLTARPPSRFVWTQPGNEAHVADRLADHDVYLDETVNTIPLPADPAIPDPDPGTP